MSLDRDFQAKAARMRAGRAFGSLAIGGRGGSRGGGSTRQGCVLKGGYHTHRGSKAHPGANGKLKAHISYISGERHKEAERERRHLFNDHGQEQTALEARERHGGCFIEHRIILSPSARQKKVSVEDLHVLAQATVQEVRARNPKAEIEASYAIHTDTKTPHAHILLTSDQRVRLTQKDYAEIREMNADLRQELDQMRSRGLHHSHELELELDNEHTLDRDQGRELGRADDLDLGVSI